MAATESKIRLIFDGVDRVSAIAKKVGAAVKGMSNDTDRLSNSLKTLDAGASKVGTALSVISKGVLALGAVGSAVSTVGSLVGLLAQLSPIALVLPGVLLAGAAAMTTFKIATAGFGEAIGAGLTGDMTKFAEATKDMAPAMRDAAKAVVAFKPQVDDLKKTVQGNFWAGFSGEITKLGNTLLPVLKRGLGDISTNLGSIFREAVKAAQTPFFQGAVGKILANTSLALGAMKPVLADVLTGFVSIGQVGSEFLPEIGRAVADVTQKFKDWATSVEGQNQIRTFIENAIQGFRDLGGILENVLGIANKVFSGLGASMESPLAMLRDLTEQLNAFLETAEAQEGLRALGEILQEAGTAIKEVFLAAVKELLPIIKEWAPAIKEIIGGLKDFALELISVLGPALRETGAFLSEHKDILREIIPVVAAAVLAFKGFKILTSVVGWATGAAGALRKVADALPGIAGANGKNAGKNLSGLVGPLKSIAGVVGLGLVAIELDKINVAAAGGDPANLQGMEADLHGILEVGKQLLAGDLSGILQGVQRDIDQVSETWRQGQAPIQQYGESIGTFLLPGLAALGRGFRTVEGEARAVPPSVGVALAGLGDVVANVGNQATIRFSEAVRVGFDQARTIVASVPTSINTALSPITGLLGGTGTTATNSFKTSAQAGFNAATAATRSVPGAINGALSTLSGLLGNTATSSTDRFKSGAQAGFNAAVSNTRPVPGQINSALSPLAGQLGTTGSTAGRTFDTRLSGALRAAEPSARSATSGIAGAVSGALSGLGGVGSAAGAALGRGLVSGLNSMAGAVSAAAKRIADTAAQAVAAAAAIRSPSRVFAALGKQMGAGLVLGMADSRTGVASEASRLIRAAVGASLSGTGLSISAPNSTAGAMQSLAASLAGGQAAPVVRVFIGDRELTNIVRTEITSSNRATRRTVTAGSGTTF